MKKLTITFSVLGLMLFTQPNFAVAQSFGGPLQIGTTTFTTIAGDAATSTFSNGVDLGSGGCFSIAGVCISSSFMTIGSDIVLRNDAGGLSQLVIGNTAFDSYVSGDGNVAVGHQAFSNFTSGSWNIALGRAAGYAFDSGNNNLLVGTGVGKSHSGLSGRWSGSGNSFLGDGVADSIADGATLTGNTIIGNNAADNQTLGDSTYNILIGANINLPEDSGSYQLNIGNILYGTNISGSGYDVSSGRIGIGTATPSARLTVSANDGETNSVLFRISSSSENLYSIDNVGHVIYGGVIPTISSCGTGPSITGNDSRGRVTTGSSTGASCQVDFAHTWVNPPVCTATQESGTPEALAVVPSTDHIVITAAGSIGTADVSYSCDGF